MTRLSGTSYKARLLLLLVAVLLLAVSCGGDEDESGAGDGEITVEYLTGTWRGIECGCRLVFDQDGTYQIGGGNTTVEQGDFTVEGTSLTFVSNDESQNCNAGERLTAEIEVLEDSASGEDRMRIVTSEDECAIRGSVKTVHNTRVSE